MHNERTGSVNVNRHGMTVPLARIIVLLTTLAVAQAALAIAQEPHELVSTVIHRVISKVGCIGGEDGATAEQVQAVFEQEISPHLDFVTISRWLAGEKWAAFTPGEQGELVAVVRSHIIHVYAALLARGTSVDIEVDPSSTVRTRSARVGAILATPDGQSYEIEFRLIRSEDSWKLFDLSVGGLSFARSLRAELAPVIGSGGLEGLKAYFAKHGR